MICGNCVNDRAALSLPNSNVQVEGQIKKLVSARFCPSALQYRIGSRSKRAGAAEMHLFTELSEIHSPF